MSGVYLESAYYGDEKSFANITQSLAKKVTAGILDVTSNSQLKPTFEAAPETTLDGKDEKKIREEAVRGCGGEADQKCLEAKKLQLSQERLKEKEMEDLGKGVIKGERLTVNIVENGKRKTLITPSGQKLRLENILGDKASDKDAIMALPSPSQFQSRAIALITIVLSTFIWVFGIVAVYAVFMRLAADPDNGKDYYRIIAYAGAAASVIFPGTGFLIILGYFGFKAFMKNIVNE
jgi:hypothetical protein